MAAVDITADPRFVRGVSLFNDGEYLEASDFFEELFFEGVRDYHAETGQLRPAVERTEEGLRLVASNRDDHGIDLLALASGMRVGVRNLRHKIKPQWPKIEIRVI